MYENKIKLFHWNLVFGKKFGKTTEIVRIYIVLSYEWWICGKNGSRFWELLSFNFVNILSIAKYFSRKFTYTQKLYPF